MSDVCLDAETLAALQAGMLSLDRVGRAERHLDRCAACAMVLAELARQTTAASCPGEASPPWLRVGERIGRYRIEQWLGAGGMGQVYLAHDPELDRPIALKVVGEHAPPAFRARLAEEARVLARLNHRNVVTVFDVGRAGERLFIAMELIAGETLARWLRGPRTPREIVQVFSAAGRGLAAAHRAGIAHRDFKPSNVLLASDGRVVVIDFGLAAALAAPGERRAAVGTPAYMAPEQRQGASVDARTDQYAFCVSLAAALAGRTPAADGGEPDHRSLLRHIPRRFRRILSRGLACEPAHRYPEIDSLLRELRRAAAAPVRRAAILGVSMAAVGAAFVVGSAQPAPALPGCEDAAPALALDTDAHLASALTRSVGGGATARDGVTRLIGGLRERADGLDEGRRVLCHAVAAGEVTRELGALALRCHQDGAHELQAFARLLAGFDHVNIDRAVAAVHELPEADRCGTRRVLARLGQRDEALQPEEHRLQRALREAMLVLRTRSPEEARQALEPLIAQTEGASPALRTEALDDARHLYEATGELARAERAARDAVLAAQAAGSSALTARTAIGLSGVLRARNAPAEDVAYWLEMAEAASEGEGARIDLGYVELARGALAHRDGDFRAAIGHFEAAVAIFERHLGDDHLATAEARAGAAAALSALGEPARALAAQRQALETLRAALGDEHDRTIAVMGSVAASLARAGQLDEAAGLQRRVLEIRRARRGDDEVSTARAAHNLAVTLLALGEVAEADALLAIALAVFETTADTDRERAAALVNRARALVALGRDEAGEVAERAREAIVAAFGAEHPNHAVALTTLASVSCAAGACARAEASLRTALALQERTLGSRHPELAFALVGLGRAHLERGERRAAHALLERARSLMNAATPPGLAARVALELSRLGSASARGPLLAEARRLLTERAATGLDAVEARTLAEIEAAIATSPVRSAHAQQPP